jgi:hypothetical protein
MKILVFRECSYHDLTYEQSADCQDSFPTGQSLGRSSLDLPGCGVEFNGSQYCLDIQVCRSLYSPAKKWHLIKCPAMVSQYFGELQDMGFRMDLDALHS